MWVASAWVWEDPLGQCVFSQGVRGGVAIHKAFPSCELVSEKHFLDVEEYFCCVYLFRVL